MDSRSCNNWTKDPQTEKNNIFQIWRDNGETVPFAVRRENWNEKYYVVVEKIEVGKWPYGRAYGYPTENGHFSNYYEYSKEWRTHKIIPCAGCYQWSLVENIIINEKDFLGLESKPICQKQNLTEDMDTYQITYHLLKENFSIEEIAKRRDLRPGTIYSHIETLIQNNFFINLNDLLSEEKQKKILEAAQFLKPQKLKELKDYLGNNYSYDEIRIVLAKPLEINNKN